MGSSAWFVNYYNLANVSQREYYVYIMASLNRTIYTGVTSDLGGRGWQHKEGVFPGFSSKYHCHRLVYYERFSDVHEAIAREKQIKRWRREKKVFLIERENPQWLDLWSADDVGRG